MDHLKEKDDAQVEMGKTEGMAPMDDIHEFKEQEGYIVDAEELGVDHVELKLAPDGHTILVPQPSDDPNDPLNWSSFKKNLILIILTMTSFTPDYGSATGAVDLIPQSL